MRILTISSAYPYRDSNDFIFVKQLMDQFVTLGYDVIVIAPQSITKTLFRKKTKRPYHYTIPVDDKSYTLYSPKYISFSNIPILKKVAGFLFRRAVIRTVKKEKLNFDITYSHFLNGPGTTAFKIYRKYDKPYFIAFGESTFKFKKNKLIKKTLKYASGFITVSTEMKQRLLQFDKSIPLSKISVHSNGYNPKLFYPKDKKKLRKKFNINEKDFVVIFVGGFIHRKGTLRLNEALKNIDNPNIKAIFIGQGPENPDYDHIIYKGRVLHNEINDYLNLSDLFVLPTLNEGSCNAIIEAMGAGLPIISSNNSFNDDILADDYSIRINPKSVDELRAIILKLYQDKSKLQTLSKSALNSSKKFYLETRAMNIIEFIDSKIQ